MSTRNPRTFWAMMDFARHPPAWTPFQCWLVYEVARMGPEQREELYELAKGIMPDDESFGEWLLITTHLPPDVSRDMARWLWLARPHQMLFGHWVSTAALLKRALDVVTYEWSRKLYHEPAAPGE